MRAAATKAAASESLVRIVHPFLRDPDWAASISNW